MSRAAIVSTKPIKDRGAAARAPGKTRIFDKPIRTRERNGFLQNQDRVGSGRGTWSALTKLLLRSMDASSTVVGPAPATPPQLPPAAGAWRAACIPPLPLAPAGRASGEGGTGRSEEGKSSERSTGESGVEGKRCLANRRQLSVSGSLFYCPPPPLSP